MRSSPHGPLKDVIIAGLSGGIGKAIAEKLLHDDPALRIWGLCRDPTALDFAPEVATRVAAAPWDARSADAEDLNRILQGLLPADLAVDTVIYAAGILHGEGLFPEKRLDELQAQAMLQGFQVNALGFALLIQGLQPWLQHAGFKRVLAISAKVGSLQDNRMGGWYAYRTSKAALNMLVRNLAVELPRRYRPLACVAVHPGTTRTGLSEPFSRSLAQLNVHEPSATAGNVVAIARSLDTRDNGRFINWDGADLPW